MLHHHLPGHDPERLWLDRLAPRLEQLRESLAGRDPGRVAERSGATWHDGRFVLSMLFDEYEVDGESFDVRCRDEDVDSFRQSLLLTYLKTADGTPASGTWISFRELPDGAFYHRAFQGYAPDRLVRRWSLDVDGFTEACLAAGGTAIDHGSAGFSFPVFPKLEVAAVYWAGDEEMPSKASILFDAHAHHYMVTDGLAILGSRLVDRIVH